MLGTVDFITPPCDDPADFGRIAAANSASDIFAMNGRGIAALSVTCFPAKKWPLDALGEILRAGAEKLAEADIPVIGGHTVEDPEMKVGYAVVGVADPSRLWRNSTAREGDVLLLTKPVGTGVLAAAARAGQKGEWWTRAVASMSELNLAAARALAAADVHAVTDVTGFGLAGHAAEMARGAGLTVRLRAHDVPLLDEALPMRRRGFVTRAPKANAEHARWRVEGAVDPMLLEMLIDPQTSGGLLVAAPDADAASRLRAAGCLAAEIGSFHARTEGADVLVA